MSDKNFFAVRDEIAEKLTGISGLKKIYTPANSATVTELSQVTPNAQVYYRRIRKLDDVAKSSMNMLAQQWEVTVVERHASAQLNDGSAVLDRAGALTQQVLELLSGWQPASSARPLNLIAVEEDYSPTCVYITLVFESKMFI
ncbi:hypothetical protein NVT87_15545 [Acinetobacter radioresistens]|uniref:Uncharacterized protein n=1 Tax=Acinetobacter radioresistens TaxID=40216 RepID=A0A8H2JYD7_ACIRA|nr:hypothetical protein [Acinetobacter radioresistens]MCX0332281.1 hypothetical protein [Acinetobacter radioresistens]TNX85362.1 hypothetical protein FHY67_15015 [Acinetobacter radioresistens]